MLKMRATRTPMHSELRKNNSNLTNSWCNKLRKTRKKKKLKALRPELRKLTHLLNSKSTVERHWTSSPGTPRRIRSLLILKHLMMETILLLMRDVIAILIDLSVWVKESPEWTNSHPNLASNLHPKDRLSVPKNSPSSLKSLTRSLRSSGTKKTRLPVLELLSSALSCLMMSPLLLSIHRNLFSWLIFLISLVSSWTDVWRDWPSSTLMVNLLSPATMRILLITLRSLIKYKKLAEIGSWSALVSEKFCLVFTWNWLLSVLTSSCKWRYNKTI